jgi:hypothetical protein
MIKELYREINAFCKLACSDIQKELDEIQAAHGTLRES